MESVKQFRTSQQNAGHLGNAKFPLQGPFGHLFARVVPSLREQKVVYLRCCHARTTRHPRGGGRGGILLPGGGKMIISHEEDWRREDKCPHHVGPRAGSIPTPWNQDIDSFLPCFGMEF